MCIYIILDDELEDSMFQSTLSLTLTERQMWRNTLLLKETRLKVMYRKHSINEGDGSISWTKFEYALLYTCDENHSYIDPDYVRAMYI